MANPNPKPSPATQFKPGNPGGPGRPRKSPITDALLSLIDEKDAGRALATVILTKAMKGDPRFMAMLLERAEGKVAQSLTVEGGQGNDATDELRAIRKAGETP